MTPSQRTSTVVEDEASTKEVGFAGGSPYFPRKGRKEGRKGSFGKEQHLWMMTAACLAESFLQRRCLGMHICVQYIQTLDKGEHLCEGGGSAEDRMFVR